LAGQRPVLAVYEDAHWVDPSTLELLGLVVQRVQRLPALVLITFRPEFIPPWTSHAHVTRLSLSRLTRRHGSAIALHVTGGKALPAEVLEQIVARTDGVPLFVEELTKAVVESGLLQETGDQFELTGPLPPLAIPTTLYDSLMARLDRFAPVKEVAQIGAVIGREFSYALLAIVVDLPVQQLDNALDQLVAAELVFRRGTPPEAMYRFKHGLVQDAAYQSLLRSRRYQLHAKIARTLEEHFVEIAVRQPELLAHHCAEGGLIEQAVDYWLAAGERSLRASTNIEAITHLSQGLRLLNSLPDSPERQRKELRFQTSLGPALMAARGWASPEVVKAYHRADELSRALGDTSERFTLALGLWLIQIGRGEGSKARALSDELFRLAEQSNNDDLRLQAHHSAWGSLTWLGQFTAAREHAQRGLVLYRLAEHGSHALTYAGHDPGVCSWAQGGLDLWFLGYPDQAAEHLQSSLALAEQIAHPPSMAHALNYGTLCHQLRRDAAMVRAWGDRMANLATKHELALYEATSRIARGWLLADQGQPQSAILEFSQGLKGCWALGMRMFEPYQNALLAAAHSAAGEVSVGFELLKATKRFAEKSGMRYWDAELLRLEGQLLLHLAG